jgi:hypothetical protein
MQVILRGRASARPGSDSVVRTLEFWSLQPPRLRSPGLSYQFSSICLSRNGVLMRSFYFFKVKKERILIIFLFCFFFVSNKLAETELNRESP